MQYFLSFSYNLHDSSVSIADEQRVLLVLEAERYFGEKKKACTHEEMERLVAVALQQCGIGIDAVASVACTAYRNEHLPEKLRDVRWLDEHRIELGGRRFDTLIVNHHLSHAAMVHAFPQATDTVIDVCDGGGDFGDTHFVYRCRNGRIEALPNQPIHDAFSSRFYDIVSRYLYGRIMCEGKLMALASLGQPQPEIMTFLREHLPMFHGAPPEQSLAELKRRYPVEHYSRSQTAFDLAASVQRLFEDLRVESVLALPREAPFVLLAGGATLNIVANTRVRQAIGPGRQLLLPPCCDDTGQSLGALLLHCHEKVGAKVTAALPFLGYSDRMGEPPLSPSRRPRRAGVVPGRRRHRVPAPGAERDRPARARPPQHPGAAQPAQLRSHQPRHQAAGVLPAAGPAGDARDGVEVVRVRGRVEVHAVFGRRPRADHAGGAGHLPLRPLGARADRRPGRRSVPARAAGSGRPGHRHPDPDQHQPERARDAHRLEAERDHDVPPLAARPGAAGVPRRADFATEP